MKSLLFFVVAVASGLAFPIPRVDQHDIVLSQDQFSRKVSVSYVLSGDSGIVTMDVETNAHDDVWVPIGDKNLRNISGDFNIHRFHIH